MAVIAVVVLVFAFLELILPYFEANTESQQLSKSGFHVGASFCGNTSAQAKLLIERVKNYTNLFVVQSGPVSTNETSMNEIVDYAVKSSLDVIVYFGYFHYSRQIPWLDHAKQQWGIHFLGVYLNDEPGGRQLTIIE